MSKPLLTFVALVASAGLAHADGDPDMQGPPTKAPVRSGVTATLAVGPGELHIVPDSGSESRTEGAGFSLRVGTTLSPTSTFELMVDFVDGSGTRSTVAGAALKFYPADPVYVRLGGGLGVLSTAGAADPMDPTAGGGTSRHGGVAALLAAGYEWLQLRDIALFGELEVTGNRLTAENAKTSIVNAQLLFGITWY